MKNKKLLKLSICLNLSTHLENLITGNGKEEQLQPISAIPD